MVKLSVTVTCVGTSVTVCFFVNLKHFEKKSRKNLRRLAKKYYLCNVKLDFYHNDETNFNSHNFMSHGVDTCQRTVRASFSC